MVMRQLEISNLRNLTAARLQLAPHFNYLVGGNGAGKTSVLEAVYLLARARSFRGASVASLISKGHDSLLVRADLEDGHSLGLSRAHDGNAVLHIDQQPVRKLSSSAALLPLQLLSPDVGDLVFAGPGGRRKFLDWGLFHMEQSAFAALRDFRVANRQRNAVLKSWCGRESEQSLEVWTDAFCRHAAAVDAFRREYAEALIPVVREALGELRVAFQVGMTYRNGWGDASLRKVLEQSIAKDVKSGVTSLGPHRADLSLEVPEGQARAILSRGQGKLLAVALILAQARLLQAHAQRRTLFLIDELGAEMDQRHLARMLALLDPATCQVIATSTQPPGPEFADAQAGEGFRLFHVEQGEITARA